MIKELIFFGDPPLPRPLRSWMRHPNFLARVTKPRVFLDAVLKCRIYDSNARIGVLQPQHQGRSLLT
jgi:hypothetical protein